MKTSFLNSLAISACKTFLNCACIKNEGEFHGEMKCEDELKCSHLASISLMVPVPGKGIQAAQN